MAPGHEVSFAERSPADQWWTLIHFAVMAPSGHNTQPWRFHVRGRTAELHADRTRALPVVDPEGRELLLSCGAALLNLRLAIHHFGLGEETAVLPDPAHPDLLARITLTDSGPALPGESELFAAIPERRTNRASFEPQPAASDVPERLQAAAELEGAWLVLLRAEAERRRIAELIAEGDRIQAGDEAMRAEMAAWVRSNGSAKRDGLRGYSFGHGRLASLLAPLYLRYANWGESQAKADQELAMQAPLLAVLGTADDTPRSWMAAGQALARVLLTAQSAGLSASFFNQPIEVESLRPCLAAAAGASGYPQICLRLGVGQPVLPSPRRPVDEVVVSED